MNFALGFVQSSSQIIIREFSSDSPELVEKRTLDLMEMDGVDLQGILVPKKLMTSEVLSQLNKKESLYPIRESNHFFDHQSQFEEMNYSSAQNVFLKMHENWVLQNNVKLIEEIINITNYLKTFFHSDRTKFFTELWTIIRTNLGASKLRIIYNDILPGENGKKNQLINSKIEGKNIPEYSAAEEADSVLMEQLQGRFTSNFEIDTYDKEKNELSALVTINNSPVLIMANIFSLTAIQKSVIKAIFDGIQTN